MGSNKPRILLYVGAGLMVLGVIFPFLMVIKIIESTYFLNFFSYTLQIIGLVLAMVGIADIAVHRKK